MILIVVTEKSLKISLSALFSHPEDPMLSNERVLGFLYLLLFCCEKIASILRAARCHILGLPHLMTPHSVTPVYSPACFNVSCHFPNKRKCLYVSKTRFLIKVFLEMLQIALRLGCDIWLSPKASPQNSIPCSSMKIFSFFGNVSPFFRVVFFTFYFVIAKGNILGIELWSMERFKEAWLLLLAYSGLLVRLSSEMTYWKLQIYHV